MLIKEISNLSETALAGTDPYSFQRLCGKLAFAAQVCVEGRTRCFFMNQKLAELQNNFPVHLPKIGVVEVNKNLSEELKFWKEIEDHPKFSFEEVGNKVLPMKIFVDASSTSFGIKFGSSLVRGQFDEVRK